MPHRQAGRHFGEIDVRVVNVSTGTADAFSVVTATTLTISGEIDPRIGETAWPVVPCVANNTNTVVGITQDVIPPYEYGTARRYGVTLARAGPNAVVYRDKCVSDDSPAGVILTSTGAHQFFVAFETASTNFTFGHNRYTGLATSHTFGFVNTLILDTGTFTLNRF